MDNLKSLVISARSGDLEAFERIVQRFQDMAYGYAYSILGDFHLAEDAAQEAFIGVYCNLSKLRNPEAFAGWFRQIVFSCCSRITRRRRIETVPLDATDGIATSKPGPAEIVEKTERQEKVLDAVHALPEHQRVVTMLFYIDGYSQKEIAEFLQVPITTIKKRLYDARRRLKKRMIIMVEKTLKKKALPEDFAQKLLMFPFPRHEPSVKIDDCPGERLSIRCIDAQPYFVPLVEGGKCDWTFYDWPNRRLTGVNECHVVGRVRWKNANVLRIWRRSTDLKEEEKQEWGECHYLIEDDTWRWVKLERDNAGKAFVSEHPSPGAAKDPRFEGVPMRLEVGLKWGGFAGGEVVGVSEVHINQGSWKCLKIVHVGQHFKNPDNTPATYAEWYVAENGRTVFFRRYNGPGYAKPESPRSFESLAGNLEVEFQGITFRHSYDCIPDIALF